MVLMDDEKWKKYLRIDEEDYSGSCEVDEGARMLHRDLISLLPGGGAILDVGCGTGWSTEELSKKYGFATGISIQHAEVDYAMKNHKTNKTAFIEMDMHDMSFRSKKFDAVYAREVLEHSVAPFIALCEINRVLKMNGRMVVNVPGREWIDWHCHYIVPTAEQLNALLKKTGFAILKNGVTKGSHIWRLTEKVKEAI